jgi:hypothetical protein
VAFQCPKFGIVIMEKSLFLLELLSIEISVYGMNQWSILQDGHVKAKTSHSSKGQFLVCQGLCTSFKNEVNYSEIILFLG